MTTHLVPPEGDGITPCCGKSPFELPPGDRITRDERALDCCRQSQQVLILTHPPADLSSITPSELSAGIPIPGGVIGFAMWELDEEGHRG